MLWDFKLESDAKLALYNALPEIIQEPLRLDRFAGGLDAVSDAQLMALRNVLERR